MSTSERTILIVGQAPDVHIESVMQCLEQKGATVALLRRGTSDLCGYSYDHLRRTAYLQTENSRLDLSAVTCVWWRVKPSANVEFSGGTGSLPELFQWAEWRQFLSSIEAFTSASWVNPTSEHRKSSLKPCQLALAQAVGMGIPRTAISNSVDDIVPLFECSSGRVVYKTLSSFLSPPDQIIYTSEITHDDVTNSAERIGLAPGIFQEYIEKDYELRVTVVGEDQYCVRIWSQKAEHTMIDWRRDQLRDMYEVFELDSATSEALARFHRKSGLIYAAYDLVVDKNGTVFFLECNPGGQWLWLEEAVGIPITEKLTETLVALSTSEFPRRAAQ